MSFLSLLLLVAACTGLVKLSALLLRRSRLGWRDACIFSLIVLAVLGGGALLNRLSGNAVPLPVAIAAGMIIQTGIGAWYLGPRAHTAAGVPLAAKGGALLALVAYGLIASVALFGGLLAISLVA